MSSFGIISSIDGRLERRIGEIVPSQLTLEEGKSLSYQDNIYGANRWEPILTYEFGCAKGRAERSATGGYYSIYIVGTSIADVEKVIHELEIQLGAVDLTPKLLSLPDISGIFARFMYLVRYVVKGTTEA